MSLTGYISLTGNWLWQQNTYEQRVPHRAGPLFADCFKNSEALGVAALNLEAGQWFADLTAILRCLGLNLPRLPFSAKDTDHHVDTVLNLEFHLQGLRTRRKTRHGNPYQNTSANQSLHIAPQKHIPIMTSD